MFIRGRNTPRFRTQLFQRRVSSAVVNHALQIISRPLSLPNFDEIGTLSQLVDISPFNGDGFLPLHGTWMNYIGCVRGTTENWGVLRAFVLRAPCVRVGALVCPWGLLCTSCVTRARVLS